MNRFLKLALITSVLLTTACQVSEQATSSTSAKYTQTTVSQFAKIAHEVCLSKLPNTAKAKQVLSSKGYKYRGSSGGQAIYIKAAGEPIVSVGKGAKGSPMCSVYALGDMAFISDVSNHLVSNYGITKSGSFISKPGVAGTSISDNKPEGHVVGYVFVGLI